MVGEHVAHALARALAPERDDDALAAPPAAPATCVVTASKTLRPGSARSAAKLRPCLAPTSITSPCPSGTANGVSRASAAALEPLAPFGVGEIEPVGRQRLVGRPAVALRQRLCARLVIVRDLGEPLARGVLGQRLEHDRRARHIVEQRVEPVVEQRQPVLHAGMAAAFAHRLVEQVVRRRRAERRDIAGAEAPDGLGRELELGDRHEIERAQLVDGALGLRIEAADRLQRVAEEIEPHRLVHARRDRDRGCRRAPHIRRARARSRRA